MTNTTKAAVDWYPDPSGRHEQRYWDGRGWSHQVANGGVGTTDPFAGRGRQKPVYDSHGSLLLFSGLRKWLLWGPIITGVGVGIFYAGFFSAGFFSAIASGSVSALGNVSAIAWGVLGLGGLIAIFGWIVSFVGIVEFIDGVRTLGSVVERAASAALQAETDPSTSWPAPSKGQSHSQAEATAREVAQLKADETEPTEHFSEGDLVLGLLSDPELAEQARSLRRTYGPGVVASFLKRKASELGLEDVEISKDDIPDKF